ncbi:hypothetical protein JXR93_12565, partial [bacterium]|nr:hypothetical protein [bacterium]
MSFLKKITIKTKLLFIASIVLAIGVISLIASISTTRDYVEKVAYFEYSSITENYASEITTELKELFNLTQITAQTVTTIKSMTKEESVNRSLISEILKLELKKRGNLKAFWSSFELNVLNPDDSKMVETEFASDIGRFMPSFYFEDGEVKWEEAGTEDSFAEEDWFVLPRKEQKDLLFEPYEYSYDDSDSNSPKIWMTSITSPIFFEKKYIGTIGVDISLEYLQNRVTKLSIDNKDKSGIFGFIISSKGGFLAHPKKELLGKSIFDTYKEIKKESISKGESFILNIKQNKKEYKTFFYPIKLDGVDSFWYFALNIPIDNIMAPVKELRNWSIAIGVIFLFFLIIVIVFISKGITDSISYLKNESKRIKDGVDKGDFSQLCNSEGVSKDFQSITDGINSIVLSFKEPLNEIISTTNDLSKGKEPQYIDKNYDGEFLILKNGINQLIDANKKIAEIAQKISNGDFNIDIKERSD